MPASMAGTPSTLLFTQQEQGASSIEYLQNYLQLYAMWCGAVPIAHKTGGLKDTVIDFNPWTQEGTGWTCTSCNAEVLSQGADDKDIFLTRLPLTIPAPGVLSSLLPYVPAIHVISLVHASIDDDGAVELAIGLRQSHGNIWALDLRNNKIADRGAAALAGCLPGCPALHELMVSHNRIGDEGLQAFTHYLASSNGVLRIHASHNPSSPEAIKGTDCNLQELQAMQVKEWYQAKATTASAPTAALQVF